MSREDEAIEDIIEVLDSELDNETKLEKIEKIVDNLIEGDDDE